MKKIYVLMIFALVSFLATTSFAQTSHQYIELTKDSKTNGYKIIQRGRDDFLIIVQGVVNPDTGKKLDGFFDLEYRCDFSNEVWMAPVRIVQGTSVGKKIECTEYQTPRALRESPRIRW